MIELEFVDALPPKVPAWCSDLAEALREQPGRWAKWPRTGFPGLRHVIDEVAAFVDHYGPVDGYFTQHRDGTTYARYVTPVAREAADR